MNPQGMQQTTVPGQIEVDQTKVPQSKTFYASLDGCAYYFANGHQARFENGMYVTDKKGEIEELEKLCKTQGNYLISDKPLEVLRSDAKILKDVSASGASRVAMPNSGTGTLNTQMLAGLSIPSGK